MQHYLDDLFNPKSIAIVGASERADAVGHKVMSNLLHSKFPGALYPVNPKHQSVLKHKCYASLKDIAEHIDLVVITTPAQTVPAIMQECADKDVHCVIIISAGFSEMGDEGKKLEKTIIDIARRHQIRFIGPNCLGVMRPVAHLNATFDNNNALPGKIALISQSGAICAAILDWALEKEIGFSTIVSMGNSSDVDFGDILNYLAQDKETTSILLYIEGIHQPRLFLEGLRAAARVKPVIALKAGRHASGVRAAYSHTGALVGNDEVFSAALRRGGAVRVLSIEQLFTAAQVLSGARHATGNQLTIVTNGGGAGVMAADRAADVKVDLPELSADLIAQLDKVLPTQWSHQNPIDILGDATPERYRQVLDLCLQDKNNNAFLTVLVPVAMSQPLEVAKEVCAIAKKTDKPLIACWMGEKQSKSSWKLFEENKIPCYSTPEVAVEAFSYLADYHETQQLLKQMPIVMPVSATSDVQDAKTIINNALSEKRKILTTIESKKVLAAFGVPVAKTIEAHTAEEAAQIAESLGFPLVMKISSPDITHKQDVGGVQVDVKSSVEAATIFKHMLQKVRVMQPDAKINGITLERMSTGANYRELMIGVIRDKVFGPVISVGTGGSLVEVIQDSAVALPPLNEFLAQRMLARTRAMKMLGEFRGKPAVKMDALIKVLLSVSDMVSELPEIQEMDINPLMVDENGAIAVDARFVVAQVEEGAIDYRHLVLPYF